MMKKEDLHIHTYISDGTQSPFRVLEIALSRGLEHISITDHDALDAHRMIAGSKPPDLKIDTGVEIDCRYCGRNIEVLGYGFDIDDGPLNDYLRTVQQERRKRAQSFINRLNEHFGKVVLTGEEVFPEGRVTVLKPHIIHPLLEKGLFSSYGEAKKFMARLPDDDFSRATAQEAIGLIHGAGGKVVLAHPGVYPFTLEYVRDMVRALKMDHLDGLETWYPYCQKMGERFPDHDSEKGYIAEMEDLGRSLNLFPTRGTDSHREEELTNLNSGL